ncbi:hypothetical protein HZA41_02170 [Candidatus Peregrinibacteria bacterium]|nr:hypothetical protein [Candidatus Peregrinibacteria bacterium]
MIKLKTLHFRRQNCIFQKVNYYEIMTSIETTKNIQKVSLIFFAIIGTTHILSGLFLVKNYFPIQAYIINRTLDIPFLITSLGYGFSSAILHLSTPEKPSTILTIIFSLITVSIIGTAIYINLFISDLP